MSWKEQTRTHPNCRVSSYIEKMPVHRSMNNEQRMSRKRVDRPSRKPEVCLEQFYNSNRVKNHHIGDCCAIQWASAVNIYQNETYSTSSSTLFDEERALIEIESEIAEVKESLQSLYQEVNCNVARKGKPTKYHVNNVIDQSNQKFKNTKKNAMKSEKSDEIIRCEKEKQKCYRIIEKNLFILKSLDRVISILRRDELDFS